MLHELRGSVTASNPTVPGSILGIPDFFKFDVAEIYQAKDSLERVSTS